MKKSKRSRATIIKIIIIKITSIIIKITIILKNINKTLINKIIKMHFLQNNKKKKNKKMICLCIKIFQFNTILIFNKTMKDSMHNKIFNKILKINTSTKNNSILKTNNNFNNQIKKFNKILNKRNRCLNRHLCVQKHKQWMKISQTLNHNHLWMIEKAMFLIQ